MHYPDIRPFQAHYLNAPRDFVGVDKQSLTLEIGAGKGKHACLYAQQNPQQRVIAIERTKQKFDAMHKQAQCLALPNLDTIHADAIPWIVHALYPQQVQQCFILYPNPEPHNASQRWLNMPFFEFLLSRLQLNGRITLASNVAAYMDEAQQQLQQLWKLPYTLEQVAADSARTHFEQKYLQRGQCCQQLIIEKPQNYRTRFDQVAPRLGQS